MIESTVTRAELCTKLCITSRTALRWEADGRLQPYKLGRVIRYRESDVEELLQAARFTSRKKPGPKPKKLLSPQPRASKPGLSHVRPLTPPVFLTHG